MFRYAWMAILLMGGCIEYDTESGLNGLEPENPEPGETNPRPLEASTQTDKIVQTTLPEVDILWVVDNSCSMEQEQASLSANFAAFMDYFLGSGLSYHIGVTSTDFEDHAGRLLGTGQQPWIDPNTSDATNLFGQWVVLGTSGSGDEKGRDPAYAALETETQPGGHNEGFIRNEAAFHLVFISDEEDKSAMPVDEFVDYLQSPQWDQENLTVSSIVTPLDSYTAPCPGGWEEGAQYIDVTMQIGGILWPICNPDWFVLLNQLGLQASGLSSEYFLSQIPKPGSLEVWVENRGNRTDFVEGADYEYDPSRNSIVFESFVPGALSEVFIEYEVMSTTEE